MTEWSKKTRENFKAGIDELAKAFTRVGETFGREIKAIASSFYIFKVLNTADPKVYNLARHHPKARIRKKNLHRAIKEYEKERKRNGI